MAETIISLRNLHKFFKNVHALQGVSFDVAKGTIVGLLGPNGAGKTTLIRILTTLISQDKGVRALSLHLALGNNLWQAFSWVAAILLLFVPFAVYTYTKRST